MKHATSQMLFAYWDGLRGERAAPERGAVEPGQIRSILADTFVLARENGGGASFRLAGTRCEALFGRDLKGLEFSSLFAGRHRHDADAMIEAVTTDTVGIVAGLVATTHAGPSVPLELLLLPLRHRGRGDIRLMGALSTRVLPSWIGLFTVAGLEVRSTRVITAAPEPAPVEVRPDQALERRRRFVVLDGGRASSPDPAGASRV